MARIRKIYEDAAMTTQVYPQTHEKAVVDNEGTTAETKFQMITDLVQQAQMEVGAVPSDLAPQKNSTNWVTSGGVYNAIESAKEEFAEFVTEVDLSDRFYLSVCNTISGTIGNTCGVLNRTSMSSSNWCGAAIPCEEGDKFLVSAHRNGTDYPIAFVDADNKTLQAWTRSTDYVDYAVTAPTNAKMLLVNGTYNTVGIKKVFDKPTKLEDIGVDITKYNAPIVYGAENTRNGNISKSSTGVYSCTDGDTTIVKTNNLWLPKDTRITYHIDGERITEVGITYSIKPDNVNTKAASGTWVQRVHKDGIIAFKFTRSDSTDITPQDLTSWIKIERPVEESVEDFNPEKADWIEAATNHPSGSQSIGALSLRALPAFCVVTDVHDSWRQLWRAMDYADSQPRIIGTLFLGDITAATGYNTSTKSYYSQPVEDIIMQHNKPLLRVSGNHDSGLTRAQYMETWFPSRVISKTGETHPEGCPWWYMDFPITFNSTTKTLRVIGNFDNDSGAESAASYFGTSDEQYLWICDRLAECDSSTYVLILRHYSTIDVTEETLTGDWRMKSRYWSPTGDTEHNQGKLCGIVDAWMYGKPYSSGGVVYDFSEGGNKANQFVCYLTGHWHKDYVLKHSTYPQIDIAQCCTAIKRDNYYSYSRGDIPSATTGKNQDSFNVVVVNWEQREVRLIRMGSDLTTDLRDRKKNCIELPDLQ